MVETIGGERWCLHCWWATLLLDTADKECFWWRLLVESAGGQWTLVAEIASGGKYWSTHCWSVDWTLLVESVVRVLVANTGGREWRTLVVESVVHSFSEQHWW